MTEMPDPTPEDLFRYSVIETQRDRLRPLRTVWAADIAAYQSRYFEHEGVTAGTSRAAEDELVVENNWMFAFIDTMVANISPPNPAVTIKARREEYQEAARLREALVHDCFKREKFYAKLWKLVTRATVFPRAFLKVAWSFDKQRPIIRVVPPHCVIFDNTVEDWEDIRYVCEATVLTKQEFQQRVRKKGAKERTYAAWAAAEEDGGPVRFGEYPEWLAGKEGSLAQNIEHKAAVESQKWITVYEYWDFVEGKFYHIAEGCKVPLFVGDLPYQNVKNPFFLMTFNDNLEDIGGLSDSQLIRPSVRALNELSTIRLAYAQATIPKMLIDSGKLDNAQEFLAALANANTPGSAVEVTLRGNTSLNQVFQPTPTPNVSFDFNNAMVELRELIEFILGIASYQRGGLGHSDVATELALSDTAIRTRNSRRQKQVYEAVAFAATAIVGLYAQFLAPESTIPMRLGRAELQLLSPENLGFSEDAGVDALGYDYEALPFNAQEGNSVVQLKTLIEMLDFLVKSPYVDQYGLTAWLLELQHATKILLTEEEAAQKAQAPAPPGGGAPPPGDSDPMAGVPPEMMAALQGQVAVGDGAQSIPSGTMGGVQPGGD